MTSPDRVELSPEALDALMCKCQSLGWELAKGFQTDETADIQRERLYREFTGRVAYR